MRQIVVPIMIVVGLIAGVGAVFAIYVLDTVVDSDEFAKRTADVLSEPEVGELIAEKVVDQIVEAKPNTLAARPLLEEVVSRVVSGQAFRSIYEAAIQDVHRTIFLGETDTVSVRLTDMVLIVRTQAAVLAPQLADEIPDDITDTLIDVQSSQITVRALRFSHRVRFLAFVLPLTALIAFTASVLLATDRRRALVWIGFSIIGDFVSQLGSQHRGLGPHYQDHVSQPYRNCIRVTEEYRTVQIPDGRFINRTERGSRHYT